MIRITADDLNAVSGRFLRLFGVADQREAKPGVIPKIDPIREAVVFVGVFVPLLVGFAALVTSLLRAGSMVFYIAALVAMTPFLDGAKELAQKIDARNGNDGPTRRRFRRICAAGAVYYATALALAWFDDHPAIGMGLVAIVALAYTYRTRTIGRRMAAVDPSTLPLA